MRHLLIYGQRRFEEPARVFWSDGERLHDLNPREDIAAISTTFDWASPTRGNLQLALAILALVLDDDEGALAAHGAFRVHVIAHLRQAGWLLSSEQVIDWYKRFVTADKNLALGYPYLPSLPEKE